MDLEVLLFAKHLSTMIKSGIPLSDALSTLLIQTKPGKFKNALADISSGVDNGQTFSGCLKKHPQIFNPIFTNLIEVSESSGSLDKNLDFIANELAKSYALKKKIQGAMLYPTIIFFAIFIMGGFISFFILPRLTSFFESFEVELPLSTRILLFVSNLIKNHGLTILATFFLVFLGLKFILNTRYLQKWWHKMLLKLPFYGRFLMASTLAQLTRNLGLLLKSGVPVSLSLEIVSNSLSNKHYQQILNTTATSVGSGKTISKTLEKNHSKEFPALVYKMIEVGEKTGNLDESLLYLGNFYEEEIDSFSKNLTTILEPALLLFIGLIVGFVALAIITPIYQLTGSMRQ